MNDFLMGILFHKQNHYLEAATENKIKFKFQNKQFSSKAKWKTKTGKGRKTECSKANKHVCNLKMWKFYSLSQAQILA